MSGASTASSTSTSAASAATSTSTASIAGSTSTNAASTATSTATSASSTASTGQTSTVVAGGITVEYLDPDGEPIVPAKQVNGDVGDSYAETPPTIGNYVFKQVSANSLATSGTLPLDKGTITYEYAPVTVTRVINYLDAMTNKNIGSTTVTIPYEGTIPDPTALAISGYEAKGYQLVSNGYPTDGSTYRSAAPILSYRVLFTHQLVTLKPGDSLPTGVTLTHNVTQTIAFKYADGQPASPSVTRQVAFQRNAIRDAVTGETKYTSWQPVGASGFDALDVPTISDYEPDITQVPATTVTADSADLTQTVTYQPKTGTVDVDYYLAQTTKALQPMTELTGAVDSPYDVAAPTIAGYHLVSNDSATGAYANDATTVAFYYAPDTATSTATPTMSTSRPSGSVSTSAKPAATTYRSHPVNAQVHLAAVNQPRLAPRGPQTELALSPSATAAKLPQTSEQRPTDIWGLLALTMIGLVGVVRLRREH